MVEFTAEDIRRIAREEIRRILDAGLMYTCESKNAPQPKATSIIDQFPPSYRDFLTLKDGEIYCEYVSKEKWTEINNVARDLGYEYVSDGKNSHWRKKAVPK